MKAKLERNINKRGCKNQYFVIKDVRGVLTNLVGITFPSVSRFEMCFCHYVLTGCTVNLRHRK